MRNLTGSANILVPQLKICGTSGPCYNKKQYFKKFCLKIVVPELNGNAQRNIFEQFIFNKLQAARQNSTQKEFLCNCLSIKVLQAPRDPLPF